MSRPETVAKPASGEARRPSGSLVELRAAVAFLTRLPALPRAARPASELDRTGSAAFGVVGAAIGLAAAVPVIVLGGRLPLPAAVLALLVMVTVSGGLHLDGLADTADALAAPTPEAAERARTDPRAGAAGVAALVLDLLLAAMLLAAIAAWDPRLATAALVVAAAGSRAAPPVAAWIERGRGRRRPIGGLGGWFADRVTAVDVVMAIVTTVLVTAIATALVGGFVVPVGTVFGFGVASLGAALLVARRGQLDGDGYGAIVEITFVAILAGVAFQIP